MRYSSSALLLLLLALPGAAEIYQWKDENGKVHFSDTRPGHENFETLEAAPVNEVPGAKQRRVNMPLLPQAMASAEARLTTPEFYKNLEVYPKNTSQRMQASVRYDYYDVHVWKAHEVAATALRTSPISESGEKFLGKVDWDVQWTYQSKSLGDHACRLASHEVSVSAVIRMPRLVTHELDPAADLDVHERWQMFYRALAEHEQGHLENAMAAANHINDFFNQGYAYSRVYCSSLKEWADKHPADILSQHQQWDGTYDKETRHGTDQGAEITQHFPEK